LGARRYGHEVPGSLAEGRADNARRASYPPVPSPILCRRSDKPARRPNFVLNKDCMAPGDWALSLTDGEINRIALLARINRLKLIGGRRHACSSLFWHVPQGGPLLSEALSSSRSLPSLLNRRVGQQTIRNLVSWLSGHYRIGFVRHTELSPRGT
jgi:hypothetical protein